MKKKLPRLQLSDEQQLVLGLLLVILLAVSLLYCLGFASLALRRAWEDTDLPWATPETGEEILDVTPDMVPGVTPGPTPTPSGLLNREIEHWHVKSTCAACQIANSSLPVFQFHAGSVLTEPLFPVIICTLHTT